jgi:hypothetical protein
MQKSVKKIKLINNHKVAKVDLAWCLNSMCNLEIIGSSKHIIDFEWFMKFNN